MNTATAAWLAAAFVAVAGFAAADAVTTVGPVHAVVDNQHDACGDLAVAGACVARLDNDGSPNTWHADVLQGMTYVGVAVDADDTPAASLLPDGSLRVALTDHRAQHPIFIIIAPVVSTTATAPTAPVASATMDEDGIRTQRVDPASGGSKATESPWSDDHAVGYDHVGLVATLGSDHSDNYFVTANNASCVVAGSNACDVSTPATGTARAVTPSANYGFAFNAVEAASEADEIDTPESAAAPAPPEETPAAAAAAPQASTVAFETPAATARSERFEPQAPRTAPAGKPAEPAPTSAVSVSGRAPAQPTATTDGWSPAAQAAVAIGGAASFVWALIALYRRLTNAQVEGQDTRQRLVGLVRKTPGLRLTEAARQLGISHKGADYHVHMLTQSGLLVVRSVLRQKRLYLNGTQPERDAEAPRAAVADHPVTGAILRLLEAHPDGVTRSALHAATDAPVPTVNYHVRRLLQLGIVADDGGAPARLTLTQPATLPAVAADAPLPA